MRVRTGVAIALVFGGVVVIAERSPAPLAADIDECEDPSVDWCLGGEAERSEAPVADGRSPRRGRSAATPEVPECSWVTVPAEVVPGGAVGRRSDSVGGESRPAILVNGHPPPGVQVSWQGWCYEPGLEGFRGPFRWVPASEAPALPTPEELATDAYDAIKGRLPDPVVATNPPVGVDATVDVPVFVSVSNWQSEVVETRNLLGDTVTVRAAPQLVLDPAEPGASAVECAGPGRPYDPAGGDLWQQAAAPGACTYTYGHRTGVDGRPAEWPSSVTVRWSITWSATSGEGGDFPVVERSVGIPRGVSEVQAVLVPGGSGT